MEVVRDSLWHTCLDDAIKMYRISEADEKCLKLANATWVMKHAYTRIQNRKDTRRTMMIDKTPEVVNEPRTSKKMCHAVTMSNKPCSFRAVCGDFCKKHAVHTVSLGVKIKI